MKVQKGIYNLFVLGKSRGPVNTQENEGRTLKVGKNKLPIGKGINKQIVV